ncbi:MAG: leucine-rich repeat protein, partial [Muribaculaceae bacterium]|nr:leucine-rich repeat protein [Muribaculaceae bacterium]
MKRTNSFRLKALLTLLVSCLVTAHATTVDVDGITYYISNNKASVDYKSDGTRYSGDIVIPDSIPCDGTNYPVTGMRYTYIFQNCSELTSLTFGANFMNGSYSFDNSDSLKSVTFNYVHRRTITAFSMTFRYCTSLETVALPSSTRTPSRITLADDMFHGCTNLKAISNLPSDISYQIGVRTFYGCSSLNPLEFIDLSGATFLSSNDRTTVATAAFAMCNISSVTIPETMTEIPNATFFGCPLTEVTIPSTVTHIGAQAFLSSSYTVATPVLHEGLKYIGDNAFLGVENLNIPSTLETLGFLAGSSRLKSATVAEGNKYFEVKNNALYQNEYALNDSGEEVLVSKTLRNVIAGNGYTGPSVWKEEDELVTAIYRNAFLNIPVTGYDIPNLRSIGSAAFWESAIEKVTIKKDIDYGIEAFGNCIKLNEVTIEDGVKSLPDRIFYGCSNLTVFPSLPRSITALNSGAEFYNCGFTHVTLHPGMEAIDSYTFSKKVTDIECMSMIPPAIERYSSVNYEGRGELYLPEVTLTVPQESIELYKQHEAWGQCKEIKGNPDWAGFDGTTAALPGGLYIAHKGGNILYKQNGTTYDTGIPAGAHPFQMQIYNDALYVA